MKFLRNPVIASVLAVLIIVGSTAVNVSTRLEKACDKTEAAFFDAEGGRSPAYYVDQCIGSASSLVTVAGHYDSAALSAAAEDMKQARRELAEAYDERDISDIYEGMQRLYDTLNPYTAAADTVLLSEADQRTCADGVNAIFGAFRAAEQSSYNQNTAKFLQKTYQRFPASFFAELLDIDAPELYAAETED